MKTQPEPNPAQTLRENMRRITLAAKGNADSAYEAFNLWLLRANSAALERELTSAYRTISIRALMAETFHQLRSEGRIPQPQPEIPVTTSRPDRARPTTWARRRVRQINENLEHERQAYEDRLLEVFKVRGEPIGDCTPEFVLAAAETNERDARFMRLMASGVPPQAKIRDYVSAEEAHERWGMANGSQPPAMPMSEWLSFDWLGQPLKRWMFYGLKNAKDYATAQKMVEELTIGKPSNYSRNRESFALTILARAMNDWELENP